MLQTLANPIRLWKAEPFSIEHREFQQSLSLHLICDLVRPVRLMFEHWWNYRSDKIDRAKFRELMTLVRETVSGLLLRGALSSNIARIGLAKCVAWQC